MSEISIDTLKTMLANLDDAKKYQSLRDVMVSIEISDIKKLPPFQWQLSFLLFREHKHAPCAFTHSRRCV